MEIAWKEYKTIKDGAKTGTVTKVLYVTDPYHYTEVYIKVDGLDLELKYSCPTTLSEASKLGRLMLAFGLKYVKDATIDPEGVLVDKRVEFMTLNKKDKENKNEYANIVDDSIKPVVNC